MSSSKPLHPLDSLTADEHRRITKIVREEKNLDERTKFTSILLKEPAKEALHAFARGTPAPREASVVCLDKTSGQTYTGLVSLTENTVLSWLHRVGEQANMTGEELEEVDEALRREPRVIEALARRGITDLDRVSIEVWAYPGNLIPERYRGRRIGWTDVWIRDTPDSNIYANPVSGLGFLVDLIAMELLEVEDRFSVERADVMGEYQPELVPGLKLRDDVKPLDIVQPDGPSFTLDGYELSWQKWSMRIGFNSREGLVIHTAGYEDQGRVRPIAHRMSFAEMVVPYRDASPDHYRRTAFDIGEWGLGFMTTSLSLGCDCLGEIRYLDAVAHDWNGDPVTIENAICIHEEDDAVLWKHVDPVTGAEVRRARRLVVSFHATVANYEYLVYWRFYQDGNIECEVRATGIMVTTQFPHGTQPQSGTLVDTDTYAPFHQHFIVARLDMNVDGEENTVYATECFGQPVGPGNEHGIALVQRATALRTESEGKQELNWHTQKSWKIVNENVTNRLGSPVAYKLVPEGAFPPMMPPSAPILKRAGVIKHSLWVTPFSQDERWPCGELVVQSEVDKGLSVWTAANRSIENADIVLWYVFGINHITRPEEWPIMSMDKVSFWLKPSGFFDRNPSLDVPPSPGDEHCAPGHEGLQGDPDAHEGPGLHQVS